jgi:hypothetical protein
MARQRRPAARQVGAERAQRRRGREGRRGEHAAVDVGDGLGAGELARRPVDEEAQRRGREQERQEPRLDLAREEGVPLLVLRTMSARARFT